jgi:ABC-type glycerol-3-phosphate transport system substrate-binding protein
MRKGFVIVMAALGMTLFMLLGLDDVARVEAPDPSGAPDSPDIGAPDEATAPAISLQAVVSLDARAFEGLRRATERFESTRPEVAVTLRNVGADELRDVVRISTETGDAPDVMLYPTEWVRREAAFGRLLSLDDYISAERQSQWFETVRGGVRWNGYLWGVPTDWDPYVFVFRTDDALAGGFAEAPSTASAWLTLEGGAAADDEAYSAALLRHWSTADDAEGEEQSPADPAAGGAEVAADVESMKAAEDVEAAAAIVEAGGAADQAPSSRKEAAEKTGAAPAAEDEEAPADPAAESQPSTGAEEALRRGTATAVSRGEAAWAFVPLSQALAAASGAGPEIGLSAAAFVPDEDAAGGLPPFAGRSYVVSPATAHPAEAAEWIRFVTDPGIVEEFETTGGSRWPVTRSSYGLPSSFAAGGPTVLGATAPAVVATLPDATGLDERQVRNLLRPLLRMVDGARAAYGPPPAELPPPGDVP